MKFIIKLIIFILADVAVFALLFFAFSGGNASDKAIPSETLSPGIIQHPTDTGETTCKHSYTSAVITEPTCAEQGVKEYICSLCNQKVQASIAALGHNFVDGVCTKCSATEVVLSGTYKFNDTYTVDKTFQLPFKFISSGTVYSGMWIGESTTGDIVYGDKYDTNNVVVSMNEIWFADEEYKTFTVVGEATLTPEAYTWFKEHTTQLSTEPVATLAAGTRKFNSTLTRYEETVLDGYAITEDVSFTSNGVKYTAMYFKNEANSALALSYFVSSDDGLEVYEENEGWLAEGYRTITFATDTALNSVLVALIYENSEIVE